MVFLTMRLTPVSRIDSLWCAISYGSCSEGLLSRQEFSASSLALSAVWRAFQDLHELEPVRCHPDSGKDC